MQPKTAANRKTDAHRVGRQAPFDCRSSRRRCGGGYAWGVFEDAAEPGRYLETFQTASSLEHLRQHERVTESDARVQVRVIAFHLGLEPTALRHLLAPASDPAVNGSVLQPD